MFASSFDYLKALREGDYLCFLEWPTFLQKKYGASIKEFNTDVLTDCLILEWMMQGFRDEDIGHMEILYAAYELEYSPLQAGKYAFCLTSIMSALFSCMTFRAFQLGNNWPYNTGEAQQACQFVASRAALLEKGAFNQSNKQNREDFIKRAQLIDKKLIYEADQRIDTATRTLCHLEIYIDILKVMQSKGQEDNLMGARLALAQKLHEILSASTEPTSEATTDALNISITAIREKQPEEWENEYLEMISPPTVTEKIVKMVTSWTPRFFSWIGLYNYSHSQVPAEEFQPSTGSKLKN